MVKNPPANAGDTRGMGRIPGSGRSPGGGHGNPLQCSRLERNRGAWRAIVRRASKSWTQLKQLSTRTTKKVQETLHTSLLYLLNCVQTSVSAHQPLLRPRGGQALRQGRPRLSGEVASVARLLIADWAVTLFLLWTLRSKSDINLWQWHRTWRLVFCVLTNP